MFPLPIGSSPLWMRAAACFVCCCCCFFLFSHLFIFSFVCTLVRLNIFLYSFVHSSIIIYIRVRACVPSSPLLACLTRAQVIHSVSLRLLCTPPILSASHCLIERARARTCCDTLSEYHTHTRGACVSMHAVYLGTYLSRYINLLCIPRVYTSSLSPTKSVPIRVSV